MLIGADRAIHQVQQDDADESDASDSSSSSNNMSVSIPNDENAIGTDIEADEPDQSRIWSTSTSDVDGTLENYLNSHVDSPNCAPLLVVAFTVLNQLIKVTKKVKILYQTALINQFHIISILPQIIFLLQCQDGEMS